MVSLSCFGVFHQTDRETRFKLTHTNRKLGLIFITKTLLLWIALNALSHGEESPGDLPGVPNSNGRFTIGTHAVTGDQATSDLGLCTECHG